MSFQFPERKVKGMEDKEVNLSNMKPGQEGVVIKINGGENKVSKLSTLGIRVGGRVKKIGQQAMRGPVMVKAGRSQVAVGYRMAGSILVKIEGEEEEEVRSEIGRDTEARAQKLGYINVQNM